MPDEDGSRQPQLLLKGKQISNSIPIPTHPFYLTRNLGLYSHSTQKSINYDLNRLLVEEPREVGTSRTILTHTHTSRMRIRPDLQDTTIINININNRLMVK